MEELLKHLGPDGVLDGEGVKKLIKAIIYADPPRDANGYPAATMLSLIRVTTMGAGGSKVPCLVGTDYSEVHFAPHLLLLARPLDTPLQDVAAVIAAFINQKLRPRFLKDAPNSIELKKTVVLFWRDIQMRVLGDGIVLALNWGLAKEGLEGPYADLPYPLDPNSEAPDANRQPS